MLVDISFSTFVDNTLECDIQVPVGLPWRGQWRFDIYSSFLC